MTFKDRLKQAVATRNPLDYQLPRNLNPADQRIAGAPQPMVVTPWMQDLHPRDLVILRQATLRVHRACVGPFGQGDPTISEIDEIISSVGPVAAENMLRRAIDEKLGEYDRGRHGHGLNNDTDFRRAVIGKS